MYRLVSDLHVRIFSATGLHPQSRWIAKSLRGPALPRSTGSPPPAEPQSPPATLPATQKSGQTRCTGVERDP